MNRYEALQHAVRAHARAKDKCGVPYVLHPMAVADAIHDAWRQIIGQNVWGALPDGSTYESAAIVALLHDVLEDTNYELQAEWFTAAQWDALYAITRQPGELYLTEYIARVSENKLATIVKLGDLWHNLHPDRHGCLPQKEREGLEKRYLVTRDILWESLGQKWWPA